MANDGLPDLPADDLPATSPYVRVTEDQAMEAFFGGEDPSPDTPQGTAFLWWTGVVHHDNPTVSHLADSLSVNPDDWKPWSKTAETLHGWSLAQAVVPSVDRPDDMVFMRFVEDTGSPMMSIDSAIVPAQLLTLVRYPNGSWRVWGLGHDWPKASDVFLD